MVNSMFRILEATHDLSFLLVKGLCKSPKHIFVGCLETTIVLLRPFQSNGDIHSRRIL